MHIAIAGNIGAGKTTLTKLLAKHYKWEAQLEDVVDNPYLDDFYNQMDPLKDGYFVQTDTAFSKEMMPNYFGNTSVVRPFDFDKDGFKDVLLFGNLYASEVETTRNDASYGHYLKGGGNGNFEVIPANESGLFVKGDVKNAALIHLGNKAEKKLAILIARNNDTLILTEVNSK